MESVKVRAAGNPSKHEWDHKGRTQIVQIIVSHESETHRSLQFHYLENGRVDPSEVIGRSSFYGDYFKTITFQGSSEYITKVEGFKNDYGDIKKLSIHTNINVYEIFEAKSISPSSSNSKRFSFDFGGLNQFGGFHGSHSQVGLGSLGVYFNFLTVPPVDYVQPNTSLASEFGGSLEDDEDE